MMYHASSGMTKMANTSTSLRAYFLVFPFGALHTVLHTYDFPSCDAVLFTCTRRNTPLFSTAKSYRALSPHGFATVNPFADARAMNCISTHSPTCFLDPNTLLSFLCTDQ
jgi:hypothetical protein